ncbi:MAG TPA: hypothetical protein VEY92_00020 [Pseudoxanthomonas sp.]|nr:hypothetical protein [Pseudoxanthomonas sp.]
MSDVEYKGTVYADGLLDEEYYGRGVCRWKLTQARVHLKATGAEEETLFNASISAEPLLAEKTERFLFKRSLPTSSTVNIGRLPLFRTAGSKKGTSPIHEKGFFTITLVSKKSEP